MRSAGRPATPTPPLLPQQVASLLHEAAVHRVAERYDEAISTYKRILRSNPQEDDPAYFLALIDLAQGRPAPARERLERLTTRLPRQSLVWLAYAHALRELGQWRDSIEASRHALKLSPADTGEWFALAGALEIVGEMDEALAILRAQAADPSNRLVALMNIARVSPSSVTESEFDELSLTADASDTSPIMRGSLKFTVGPLLERKGDYDAAFAAFSEGARLKRVTLTGEIEVAERPTFSEASRTLHPHEAGTSELAHANYIKALFTPAFIAEEQGKGSHLKTPIFIVGMPRSGSTLVEQILSSHGKVRGLGEANTLFATLAGKYPLDFLAPPAPDHYRLLAADYLAAMHDRGWTTSARFVDKMLNNFLHIGFIHLMFPRATILHTVRDPVDTCLSNFRTLFQTGQEESYDLVEIGRAYVRYRQMMEHWNQVLPGRVIDVGHEDLVADPPARIRWLVTQACGLDWDPACLDFHKTRRSVRTASVTQVRQPIFTTSVQRWRRYEKHLGPLLEALGPYAPPLG